MIQLSFFKPDGDTVVVHTGDIPDVSIRKIQKFIKENYLEMFDMWSRGSEFGFYGENKNGR